jgi:hypothetical protein
MRIANLLVVAVTCLVLNSPGVVGAESDPCAAQFKAVDEAKAKLAVADADLKKAWEDVDAADASVTTLEATREKAAQAARTARAECQAAVDRYTACKTRPRTLCKAEKAVVDAAAAELSARLAEQRKAETGLDAARAQATALRQAAMSTLGAWQTAVDAVVKAEAALATCRQGSQVSGT